MRPQHSGIIVCRIEADPGERTSTRPALGPCGQQRRLAESGRAGHQSQSIRAGVLEASLKRLSRECPLANCGWTELGDQHHRTRGDRITVVMHVAAPIIAADPCTVGFPPILAHACGTCSTSPFM